MNFEPAPRQTLTVRLAHSAEDVRVAQRLRYLVFHEERGAQLTPENSALRLDADRYDAVSDHLLVVHRGVRENSELSVTDGEVVGTYRLLRQDVAQQHFGFYSAGEFDLGPLLARQSHHKFLELGRSCVMKTYRGSAVVELLWQGIWDYVRAQQIDVMIGCASFDGVETAPHLNALRYLQQKAKAPAEWQVNALPEKRVAMTDAGASLDRSAAIAHLPPLIKGYLRLGCYIGDGAVIDPNFNTIDVLVILPVAKINPRYFLRFGDPTN